ncbi:hypothetical protein [Pseudomonas prosekii]|uniref:hypothetical protein n=1 Tax=Pseudomonas prosekii TaxID=1148509 RepID=UPI00387AF576
MSEPKSTAYKGFTIYEYDGGQRFQIAYAWGVSGFFATLQEAQQSIDHQLANAN